MSLIKINDVTLKAVANDGNVCLSFKEKIEIAKKLDNLNVSIISIPALKGSAPEALLARTVALVLKNSTLSVDAGMTEESVDEAWNAVGSAKSPRISVNVPVSPVGMEYTWHQKPAKILETTAALIKKAASLCPSVNFTAEDATRTSKDYLEKIINTAIEAGATDITVNDMAGAMMPDEFAQFMTELYQAIPALSEKNVYVRCSDEIGVSAACAVAAAKATGCGIETVATKYVYSTDVTDVVKIINQRGDSLGISCPLIITEINRTVNQICNIIVKESGVDHKNSGFGNGDITLSSNDAKDTVAKTAASLGYDLTEDDINKVYDAFRRISARKTIGIREFEAIISSTAFQVPEIYHLDNFVITCGNNISSTAHIICKKNGMTIEGLATGSGPIDSAFKALEQITGSTFSLEEFRVQSLTEGKEAIGNTIVRLGVNGKIYTGNGISTDIIGASLRAYLNAVNKYEYQENN